MEEMIRIERLEKRFGNNPPVLRGIDLAFQQGEAACIIGPSGSGKSTLLRCINLLERPSAGRVLYRGQDVALLPPQVLHARVGMVFQQFNLFENMSALNNCVAGQRKALGRSRHDSEQKALYYLEQVGMLPYRDARPRQLSGGQKQRVAMARTLMQNPPVLVFDDSLSAVDAETDARIRQSLRQDTRAATVILISHRIETLMAADRILVLEDGKAAQIGTHEQLIQTDGLYRRTYRLQRARPGERGESDA